MTAATALVSPRLAGTPTIWRRLREVVGQAFSAAVAVVVTVVAVLAGTVAIANRLTAQDHYSVLGHPLLVVLSGSMTPTFRTGDVIIDHQVTAAQAGHLHVGQIITFRSSTDSNQVLTHRILAVKTGSDGSVAYQTKGDANNAPDSELRPAANVIGLYQARIPRAGYLLANLHRPLVVGLLLAAPLLWFLGGPLRQWGREEEAAHIRPPADVQSDTNSN